MTDPSNQPDPDRSDLGATRRDLGETRRDLGATRRDVGETRRDWQPATHGTDQILLRLPAALADRFRIVAEMPEQGAEADVLLVRDQDGVDYVAKIYRRGFTVDPAVSRKLGALGNRHVVRVHDAGSSEGRAYELLEYVRGGNLEGLFGGAGMPATASEVTEVVWQITAGLEDLHAVGIVHRDLKPANVLVRSRYPLELVLTDFGLSRSLDASAAYLTKSLTTSYAAPEAFSGHTSPARDWWALGIIVRELLTGTRVFAEMDERVVMKHVMTRPIDLDAVTDPRMRLLCRGLLTRDEEGRWGSAQVREWLMGGSPAVADEQRALVGPGGRKPLWFNREPYDDRQALARALAADWETAARRFFAYMGTPDNPGEGWGTLRGWLLGFDDPEHDDVEGRVDLTDTYLTGDLPPDRKLLHLLRWLAPGMAPHYLGARLLPEDLPSVARLAVADGAGEEGRQAHRIVEDLRDHELVRLLAGFQGGQELLDVERRRRAHEARWSAGREWAGPLPEPVLQGLAGVPVAARLLALAAAPEQEAESLRELAEDAAGRVTSPPTWFTDLRRRMADDPLGQLAVAAAAGYAATDARQLEQARQAWSVAEGRRLAGQSQALLWAGAGSVLVVLPWLLFVSTEPRGSAGIVTLVALVAQVGVELTLAGELAGDYHPGYSLAGEATRRAGPLRRTLGRGASAAVRPFLDRPLVGCITAVVLLFLLAAISGLTGLWTTVLLALAAAQVFWAWGRYQRWQAHHEERRRRVVGAMP